jgi:hypothetical protein
MRSARRRLKQVFDSLMTDEFQAEVLLLYMEMSRFLKPERYSGCFSFTHGSRREVLLFRVWNLWFILLTYCNYICA